MRTLTCTLAGTKIRGKERTTNRHRKPKRAHAITRASDPAVEQQQSLLQDKVSRRRQEEGGRRGAADLDESDAKEGK